MTPTDKELEQIALERRNRNPLRKYDVFVVAFISQQFDLGRGTIRGMCKEHGVSPDAVCRFRTLADPVKRARQYARQRANYRKVKDQPGKKERACELQKLKYHDPRYVAMRLARQAVRWAIARGELIRGKCEVCGTDKTQAHHDDYSMPLEVRWLCRKHHCQEHAIL